MWANTVIANESSSRPNDRREVLTGSSHRRHRRPTGGPTIPPDEPGPAGPGTIVSSGNIKLLRQYKDEGRDTDTVNGNRLTFSFVTYNSVDGLDFKVGCTRAVSFSLKAYNRLVPASRIWLGRTGTARSNPFTVKRVS